MKYIVHLTLAGQASQCLRAPLEARAGAHRAQPEASAPGAGLQADSVGLWRLPGEADAYLAELSAPTARRRPRKKWM